MTNSSHAASHAQTSDQSDHQSNSAATNEGNGITTALPFQRNHRAPTNRCKAVDGSLINHKQHTIAHNDPILSNDPAKQPPPPIDFKGRLGKRATVNRTAQPAEALMKCPWHKSASVGRGKLVEAVAWQADGEDPAAWGRMLAALSQ